MRYLAVAISGFVIAAFAFATSSSAQQPMPCAPYDEAATALSEKHQERPVHRGVADDHLIEIWVDEANGGWTVISVVPTEQGKLACMMSQGYGGWHDVDPFEGGPKTGS
jgi:hypothetical protein